VNSSGCVPLSGDAGEAYGAGCGHVFGDAPAVFFGVEPKPKAIAGCGACSGRFIRSRRVLRGEEMAAAAAAVGVMGPVGGFMRAGSATAIEWVAGDIVLFDRGLGGGEFFSVGGDDDAVYEVLLRGVFGGEGLVVAGQVGGGDLDAVEVESGEALVEVAGGESGEDALDGELDGEAVFDGRQVEGVEGGGLALVEMVIAEIVALKGAAAATASAGADVAAVCDHGYPLPRCFVREMFVFNKLRMMACTGIVYFQ